MSFKTNSVNFIFLPSKAWQSFNFKKTKKKGGILEIGKLKGGAVELSMWLWNMIFRHYVTVFRLIFLSYLLSSFFLLTFIIIQIHIFHLYVLNFPTGIHTFWEGSARFSIFFIFKYFSSDTASGIHQRQKKKRISEVKKLNIRIKNVYINITVVQ